MIYNFEKNLNIFFNIINKYFLSIVILLFIIITLFNINKPLEYDEASDAFDAIKINTDSHELNKRSFFNLITLLSMKIFGINEFAIRIPTVIAVIFSIYFLNKLVLLLFDKKIATITTLFYTFSPWTMIQSSLSYIEYYITLLYILIFYLFFKGIKENKLYLVFASLIPVIISFYASNSAPLWIPILIFLLFFIYHKQIPQKKLTITSFILIIFLLIAPNYKLIPIINKIDLSHIKIFKQHSVNTTIINRLDNLSVFNTHKGIFIFLAYIFNYIAHIALIFFFLEPSEYTIYPYHLHLLSLYLFPFIVAGLVCCYYNYKKNNHYKFLLLIFFIYPLLPSLMDSIPVITKSRDIMITPWIYILGAIGFCYIWDNYTKTTKTKQIIIGIICLNIIFSVYIHIIYFRTYRTDINQYSQKELVSFLKEKQSNYKKIYIITKKDMKVGKIPYMMDLSYLHLNFYLNYQKLTFFPKFELKYFNPDPYNNDSKFIWQNKDKPLKLEPGNLYVFNHQMIPKNNVIKQIHDPLNKDITIFSLVEIK